MERLDEGELSTIAQQSVMTALHLKGWHPGDKDEIVKLNNNNDVEACFRISAGSTILLVLTEKVARAHFAAALEGKTSNPKQLVLLALASSAEPSQCDSQLEVEQEVEGHGAVGAPPQGATAAMVETGNVLPEPKKMGSKV